mmetsp:Transcript_1473/g.3260  ORF Transcript_1473/g.3260 Transcript_1473/m.3260 type:complete len:222 (-) Transcript_1473:1613-2278(-)
MDPSLFCFHLERAGMALPFTVAFFPTAIGFLDACNVGNENSICLKKLFLVGGVLSAAFGSCSAGGFFDLRVAPEKKLFFAGGVMSSSFVSCSAGGFFDLRVAPERNDKGLFFSGGCCCCFAAGAFLFSVVTSLSDSFWVFGIPPLRNENGLFRAAGGCILAAGTILVSSSLLSSLGSFVCAFETAPERIEKGEVTTGSFICLASRAFSFSVTASSSAGFFF